MNEGNYQTASNIWTRFRLVTRLAAMPNKRQLDTIYCQYKDGERMRRSLPPTVFIKGQPPAPLVDYAYLHERAGELSAQQTPC